MCRGVTTLFDSRSPVALGWLSTEVREEAADYDSNNEGEEEEDVDADGSSFQALHDCLLPSCAWV